MIAINHGFGGLNTVLYLTCSNVLQTNGITTMSKLLSYPSKSNSYL